MVDRVGLVMFAIYQVAVTIVLVNMLIAMMSHSFEAIQVRRRCKGGRWERGTALISRQGSSRSSEGR